MKELKGDASGMYGILDAFYDLATRQDCVILLHAVFSILYPCFRHRRMHAQPHAYHHPGRKEMPTSTPSSTAL